MWASTCRNCWARVDLFFRHFMWGINIHFLSNITQGIYTPQRELFLKFDERFIVIISAKLTEMYHRVLVCEILKLFVFAQCVIFRMHFCCWCSAVRIYLDVEVMQKLSTESYSSISWVTHLMILFIFIYNSVTDKILLWGTLSSTWGD